jgi:cytochrome c peroxidase
MTNSPESRRALARAVAATLIGVACVLASGLPARPAGAESGPSEERELLAGYARPPAPPFPPENPWSAEKERLGRTLFFDPRLSARGNLSCGTCHNPSFAWGDGLPKAIGHGMSRLERRTPTILNLAWGAAFFWDGRAASLEEQALGPIAAPREMNMPLPDLISVLKGVREYHPMFEAAFPGEAISAHTVSKALATFERSVVSGRAPFDRWVEGDDRALSPSARRGFVLFNTKASCNACHEGWRFTDDSFHDIGVAGDDRGRGAILTDIDVLQFAFKTPTLRNIDRRGPYMHDGSVATLEEVVAFYNRGGDVKRSSLANEIQPLHLSRAEEKDLVEFLRALTSVDPGVELPAAPR